MWLTKLSQATKNKLCWEKKRHIYVMLCYFTEINNALTQARKSDNRSIMNNLLVYDEHSKLSVLRCYYCCPIAHWTVSLAAKLCRPQWVCRISVDTGPHLTVLSVIICLHTYFVNACCKEFFERVFATFCNRGRNMDSLQNTRDQGTV